MAKKALKVLVDIEYPDSLIDDEVDPIQGVPSTFANPVDEVRKVLEAGATEDGFDLSYLKHDSTTRIGSVTHLLCDLVEQ